jgi:hypothetical protein
VSDKSEILKRLAWVTASVACSVAGLSLALPHVRSEALGVIWPSPIMAIVAGLLVLVGLFASRRAGPLQWVCHLLLALGIVAYILGARLLLEVSGVQNIG